jgi:hypothetical protein
LIDSFPEKLDWAELTGSKACFKANNSNFYCRFMPTAQIKGLQR